MTNPWFRLYHEFATDPLIQSLAFEDQRHYIIILCLKCEGLIDRKIPCRNKDKIIRRTLGLDAIAYTEAHNRLMELQLVDKKWQPCAWDKRQFISDNSTERVRKYRKNKDNGNVSVTDLKRDCNAPDTETETDKVKTLAQNADAFAVFWAAYPKKKSKGAAEKVWNRKRLGNGSFDLVMDGLKRAKGSDDWLKDGGTFIPYPATWLNARGWEDEVTTTGQRAADSSNIPFDQLPTSI